MGTTAIEVMNENIEKEYNLVRDIAQESIIQKWMVTRGFWFFLLFTIAEIALLCIDDNWKKFSALAYLANALGNLTWWVFPAATVGLLAVVSVVCYLFRKDDCDIEVKKLLSDILIKNCGLSTEKATLLLDKPQFGNVPTSENFPNVVETLDNLATELQTKQDEFWTCRRYEIGRTLFGWSFTYFIISCIAVIFAGIVTSWNNMRISLWLFPITGFICLSSSSVLFWFFTLYKDWRTMPIVYFLKYSLSKDKAEKKDYIRWISKNINRKKQNDVLEAVSSVLDKIDKANSLQPLSKIYEFAEGNEVIKKNLNNRYEDLGITIFGGAAGVIAFVLSFGLPYFNFKDWWILLYLGLAGSLFATMKHYIDERVKKTRTEHTSRCNLCWIPLLFVALMFVGVSDSDWRLEKHPKTPGKSADSKDNGNNPTAAEDTSTKQREGEVTPTKLDESFGELKTSIANLNRETATDKWIEFKNALSTFDSKENSPYNKFITELNKEYSVGTTKADEIVAQIEALGNIFKDSSTFTPPEQNEEYNVLVDILSNIEKNIEPFEGKKDNPYTEANIKKIKETIDAMKNNIVAGMEKAREKGSAPPPDPNEELKEDWNAEDIKQQVYKNYDSAPDGTYDGYLPDTTEPKGWTARFVVPYCNDLKREGRMPTEKLALNTDSIPFFTYNGQRINVPTDNEDNNKEFQTIKRGFSDAFEATFRKGGSVSGSSTNYHSEKYCSDNRHATDCSTRKTKAEAYEVANILMVEQIRRWILCEKLLWEHWSKEIKKQMNETIRSHGNSTSQYRFVLDSNAERLPPNFGQGFIVPFGINKYWSEAGNKPRLSYLLSTLEIDRKIWIKDDMKIQHVNQQWDTVSAPQLFEPSVNSTLYYCMDKEGKGMLYEMERMESSDTNFEDMSVKLSHFAYVFYPGPLPIPIPHLKHALKDVNGNSGSTGGSLAGMTMAQIQQGLTNINARQPSVIDQSGSSGGGVPPARP